MPERIRVPTTARASSPMRARPFRSHIADLLDDPSELLHP